MIYYLSKAWVADIIIGYFGNTERYYMVPYAYADNKWRSFHNSTHPDKICNTQRVPDLYLTLLGVPQYENRKTP